LARERIIIAGVDTVIVLSLRTVLQSVGCTVIASAHSHRQAIDLLMRTSADLLLVDAASSPPADTLALCEEAKITAGIPVVLVLDAIEPDLLQQAKNAGAEGVLVRPLNPNQVRATIEFAASRNRSTSRSGTFAIEADATPLLGELSTREREVFELLAFGYRAAEIARDLFISQHTVRKHSKTIFRKLQVHSQIELMRRHGRSAARG
jgi:DNA-binding NarL/FixJ family response regulator